MEGHGGALIAGDQNFVVVNQRTIEETMEEIWIPVPLSTGKRPAMAQGESILYMQKDVGLYEGNLRLQTYDSGIAICTTHRILWIDEPKNLALALPLSAIQSITTTAGLGSGFLPSALSQGFGLKSSPKIVLTLSKPSSSPSSSLHDPSNPKSDSSLSSSSLKGGTLLTPEQESTWTCTICDETNSTRLPKCTVCGVPRTADAKTTTPIVVVGSSVAEPSSERGVGKVCQTCTFSNHPEMLQCEMCETILDTTPANSRMSTNVELLSKSSGGDAGEGKKRDLEGGVVVKMSFRTGGIHEFLKGLRQGVAGREWEKNVVEPQAVQTSSGQQVKNVSVGGGGISGIVRKVDESNKAKDDTINQAFKDLDALIANAAELVKLAESMSSKMTQSGFSTTDDESPELATFRSYMVDLGISSPVTKESTGTLFFNELSKELAAFLSKALDRHGGMLPLTDLYCLFNRARGVSLISPLDLVKGCEMFESLKMPFRLRKFESGLLVVHSLDFSDDGIAARVMEHVRRRYPEGLTALEMAGVDAIPVILAQEQLLITEKYGLVCRDDCIEGLRYYENTFMRGENQLVI
ncbi:Vacuolar protein-sorting-associated protein 36 [Chytridiales sp. JEL 0842]|nr:Vacuolar protein-sorting-associated protein 36 [Chytridiales sp. JEL 0842]